MRQYWLSRVSWAVHTNPFRQHDTQYSRSLTVPLRWPTSDSRLIVQAALHGLQQIYRPGLNYAKAGVMLLGPPPSTSSRWVMTRPGYRR
ncbi:hypothetical protein [Polaromonas sp.]|uniref:DinB/UmuC family translesion DNA polymerase n=1 Tax=Polaromonas sp. TaxID=1869339 RepID=UPI003BB68A65